MKKTLRTNFLPCLVLATSLAGPAVMAQAPEPPVNVDAKIPAAPRVPAPVQPAPPPERVFDLDFPGGGPQELIKAIEAASGHPVNAVISGDVSKCLAPPIKLRGVTVAQVLNAVSLASQNSEMTLARHLPNGSIMAVPVGKRFAWQEQRTSPKDSPVWCLLTQGRAGADIPAKVCRFYQLAPYLQSYKVEDITTAIETGWEMEHDEDVPLPKLSFHKDTKLLIAVGMPSQLEVIDNMLKQLWLGEKPEEKKADPNSKAKF
ncbi:MAG TPA: hypothetical protein VHH73_00395 [Verrucomicrobiae bacterium]|nr:hypothetical protein [Verrucomicrobiae bacterium]